MSSAESTPMTSPTSPSLSSRHFTLSGQISATPMASSEPQLGERLGEQSIASVEEEDHHDGNGENMESADSQNLANALDSEELVAMERAIASLTAGDFHRKWDSSKQFVRQLGQWGDHVVSPLIARLQQSTDTEDQWFLVRMLSQFDQPAVVEALADVLVATEAADIQTEVTKALTKLGESAIEPLTELLGTHQHPERRVLAASTLAKIRRSGTIAPLLQVAHDEDVRLRIIATEALGSFHDVRITPVLIGALGDVPEVCIEAIRALGRRRDLRPTLDLIGPLQASLYHPNESVAQESAVALGRLGGESAAIALGKTLTEALPTPVKISAVRALGWIDSPVATEALSVAFDCDVPMVQLPVKQEIARSLGQTRSPQLKKKAARPLITWLHLATASDPTAPLTEPFSIKQSVISAVSQLGEVSAIDSLIPLLSDSDPRIKMHVLSALKQIDPRSAKEKVEAYGNQENIVPALKDQITKILENW